MKLQLTNMSYNSSSFSNVLERIMQIENVRGTAVISKDGMMVANQLPEEIDPKSFSAMVAAAYASMENAFFTMEDSQIKYLITELNQNLLLLGGCSAKHLLAIYASIAIDRQQLIDAFPEFVVSIQENE